MPDEDWTKAPVDEFGLAYDHVDQHGWYRNLDPTVAQLAHLRDGDILVDYSGGTGILLDRLQLRVFDARIGTVVVDSSAKFLRVALEKFQDDPRVALRLLRFLGREAAAAARRGARPPAARAGRRRDRVDQRHAPLPRPRRDRQRRGWSAAPGRPVFINSGNIRNPRAERSEWILDETVWVVDDLAEGLVRTDPSYGAYRTRSTTPSAWPPTPPTATASSWSPAARLLRADVERAGLVVEDVREESIEAGVDDWFEFLAPTTTPCSAGSAAPSGSTARRRRRRRSPTGSG